jgi:hypothetical protein
MEEGLRISMKVVVPSAWRVVPKSWRNLSLRRNYHASSPASSV